MGAVPKFAPGFRLSVFDVIILAAGIGSASWLRKDYWPASLIIFMVVGHFFLFCNVFRISRKPELLWAGFFTLLAGSTTLCDFPGWAVSIALTLGVTILVVATEMRKPAYHGIFWRRINPGLREWWAKQPGSTS